MNVYLMKQCKYLSLLEMFYYVSYIRRDKTNNKIPVLLMHSLLVEDDINQLILFTTVALRSHYLVINYSVVLYGLHLESSMKR